MDLMSVQPIMEMEISLTELAVKGTATAVANKIKSIKDEKMQKNYVVRMMKLLMSCFQNEMKRFE